MSWFNKLEEVLNAVHNGIVAIDAEERVTIFNRQAERMLGVPAGKIIGQKIGDLLPAGLTSVLYSGKPQFGKKFERGDLIMVTNHTPIIEDDQVIGAIAVFQDVSEIESLATELCKVKELNNEFEAILESFYDGVGIIDGDGTLLRVNTSYERITGLSKHDNGVGRNVRELQDDGTVSQAVALLVLSQKKPVTIKQIIKTGKEILITGSPFFNEKGEILRVVCNVRDMTELNLLRERIENTEQQNIRYAHEIKELRTKLQRHEEFVFRSVSMQRVYKLIVRLAQVNSHVLITGESGVGKEIVATLIHQLSPRVNGPFLQINCGAIPENLLESELFGYEDGAFTGARGGGKKGIFELCEGGTLLLDEIGEMPMNMQVKLLRVLQQQEVLRVGAAKPVKFNVRVVSATNKNLEDMVAQHSFRADLFYRLNVVPIHLPPLRERTDDIVPLAIHFLERFNQKYGRNIRFEPEILMAFERHPWPGNVRELENLIERMLIMNEDEVLTLKHLPFNLSIVPKHQALIIQVNDPMPFEKAVEMLEIELLRKTLQTYPSIRQAAKVLGVSHPTVLRKIHKYKIMSVD
ncbi:sigma 54-interacting transcriptional regulator [Desulfosporosinus sp.]|uniref:sigma 54-interacting transcriptional regulator n=1 Tax=Desulfosporosinus sp. TaxID=157907 RepID=UPI0025C569D8|nr:sigma 54-interacting transcriptional regulator [Desulfosporosinus sp.]MBC2722069.1 sigma 54-interacting transcriptional regulator [Desulfosporosinus sp.]MBC2725912.1 sigma 54-interacting transcriptional regulator [Desulfosporosinus sp.]